MANKVMEFFATEAKLGTNGKEYHLSGSSIRQCEATELSRVVSESGATTTLEIGLALGASAVAIAEALDRMKDEHSAHIALDPYQADFGNVGLRELERLGLRHRVRFYPEFAEDFLYESSKQGRCFDLIFNDGAHSIGSKVTNAFYGDRCLKEGGIHAFHDAFSPSVAVSVTYLVKERGYEVINLSPDSRVKRWCRMIRHGWKLGMWYSLNVGSRTNGSLVALRKKPKPAPAQ